ncbi:hypothetical protein [Metabacillus arenae]|uniref:Uncharacterized protein n=1 Tax=Metabacillus arenae TaxID=2771434 RepID=A0A926RWV7_9BACI|nr:hypothetical protein [Metabacillus arenae]MBD1379532.1 hypothetical protein [Metabacillus arenae]
MLFMIIAIILLVVVFLIMRESKGLNNLPEKEISLLPTTDIYSYVLMEKEDETVFEEADDRLWDLVDKYPKLVPGRIISRIDRNQDVHEEDWQEVLKHTNYRKDLEPYYLFLSEESYKRKNSSTKFPWESKLFETHDIHKVIQWLDQQNKGEAVND